MLHRKPFLQAGQDLRDLPTYTLPEAATFLAVPPRTIHYWFAGNSPILEPSGHLGDISLLSFRDLAEAYTLELLRTFYGFNLRTLREVLENFRKETRLKRPLLEADLYVVLGNLVLRKPARGTQPLRMVDLAHRRNLVFPDLVNMIGRRVLIDNKHAPYRIYPWRLASLNDESKPVSIDPEVVSGRLVVTGTRVPVWVLRGQKIAGKSIQQIAQSYHLSRETVEKALLHIERTIPKKAA